ncbi:hypothetical protein, partial [Nocardia abscessus]|uniref:hypothetical protein n=1 Tax=Nocardia abscessus TaxID=120957 RepID=UPI002456D5C6
LWWCAGFVFLVLLARRVGAGPPPPPRAAGAAPRRPPPPPPPPRYRLTPQEKRNLEAARGARAAVFTASIGGRAYRR